MKLLELCEPLFQHVCRIKRLGNSSCNLEMGQVYTEFSKTLKDIQQTAESQGLINQYEKVELPLIFFIDFSVRQANLNFSSQWTGFAYERNELAGDEKFFDLLDEELATPGEDVAERLVIYYVCIGLGFTGIYIGQTDEIRRLMLRIAARISGFIDSDENSLISPEAYENIDTRDLIEPPAAKVAGIGIVLIGLIVVWLITCLSLYKWASDSISENVNTINRQNIKSNL